MNDSVIAPIAKTAAVQQSVLDAFELFTSHISLWWPLETHSVRGARAETCVFELWEGGDVFELAENSERIRWGRVLEFDPPSSFTISWHPGRDEETAQKVQVTFTESENGGTELSLLHSDWERLEGSAEKTRGEYESGWDIVLGRYLDLARMEAASA